MFSPPRRPVAVVGAGLLALVALGACSNSSGGSAASNGSAGSAVAPANPELGAPNADTPDAASEDAQKLTQGSASGGGVANPSSPAQVAAGDKLVRTASLQVQVDDVEGSSAQARQIAIAAGGMVVSENSSAVPVSTGGVDKQGSRSAMTLSVPADTLDRVLDELGKLGTTVQRTSAARDVTSQYVDTQSRITTMKAGLDQLRALVGKATDLNQIVALETEISRRQADLDALEAQLKTLDKKVAMSTVAVTLVTATNVVVPEEDTSGFLGGLKAGWKAFLGASSGVLTVLGAVLPFAVLLAIVAVPLLWWRRRRANRPEPRPAYATWAPPAAGSGGPGGGSGPEGGPGGSGGPQGRPGGGEGGVQESEETSGRNAPSEPTEASEPLHSESGPEREGDSGSGPREPETAGAGAR
ncbi:MAG TPA: DUF4349 domain-containing protein [Lapillicoccus sp.]|nr:DUF4349 domain-containing protein [Lapillicoccus sp.]